MNDYFKDVYLRGFISACISIFVPLFIWGNTIAHLPYFINKIDMANTSLGFFFMLFSAIQIIFSQFAGRLIIPKIGSKNTLSLGILIFSMFPIILIFSQNSFHFILASIPCGFGVGLFYTTCTAVTGIAERETGKILQPLWGGFLSFGFLCGAIFSSIWQYYNIDTSYLFFLLSLFGTLGFFLIRIYAFPKNKDNIDKSEKFKLPEIKILIFGIYLFIFYASVGIVGDWSAVWFEKELKTTVFFATLAVVSWGCGESLGRFAGSFLIKLINEKFVGGYLGLIGCVIFFISILTFNPYIILIGIFIIGICSSNFYPVVIRFALKQTKQNINTTAANLSTLAMGGFLIGPALVGFSADYFGLTFNVQLLCFIWFINTALFLVSIRNQ